MRKKREGTERPDTSVADAGPSSLPPPHTHTHTGRTGRRRYPNSRVFIKVGRAGRSGRVQHQQLVHVRVQPVAALEGGQQPRALPKGRVVRQRQAPPRLRGSGTRPSPVGGAESAGKWREVTECRRPPARRPPPAASCPPLGLTGSPVTAPSLSVLPSLSFSVWVSVSIMFTRFGAA